MTIKLKYNANADRMQLLIKKKGYDDNLFWLCRNQCLLFLVKLNEVLSKPEMNLIDQQILREPRMQTKSEGPMNARNPVLLSEIKILPNGNQALILFIHSSQSIDLIIKAPGLHRFKEILLTQSDRAGWDPESGMRRLKAMAQANAAIARSSQTTH